MKSKNPLNILSAEVNDSQGDFSKYIKQFNDRFASLSSVRRTWENEWKELRDLLLPRTGLSLDNGNTRDGKRKYDKIITSYVKKCVNTLASGLHSSVTPKSRRWFKLEVKDPLLMKRHSVKQWLKQVEDLIYDDLRRSKFYETSYTGFLHAIVYGTFVCGIFESQSKIISSKSLDIGEFYLGVDSDGDLDCVCRDLFLTTTQLVDRFGESKIPERILFDYRNGRGMDYVYHVKHIVCKNKYPDMVSNIWEYASVYYMNSSQSDILMIEGFNEMPFQTIIWTQEGNHVYGVSPAMDSLQDNRMLQKQQKLTLEAEDKLVRPPMVYDSQMKMDGVHDYPGGVNFLDNLVMSGKSPAYALGNFPSDLNFHLQSKEETKQVIRDLFFVDMFLMMQQVDSGRMTATEVIERNNEKLMILGPVSDSFQRNFLTPTIERVYKIRERYDMLPEVPEELANQNIDIDFISVLAMAQKNVGLNDMNRFLGGVAQMAQTMPEVMDKLNADKIVDTLAKSTGIDPNILNSEDDIRKIREGRAKQQQEQMTMAQIPQMAKGAKDLAQSGLLPKEMINE